MQVSGDYVESWQPTPCTPLRWKNRARSPRPSPTTWAVALRVSGFGVELFVKGDQVWFSEVSPARTTPAWSLCTQHQSEFELHARAILGLPVDTSLRNPGASAVIYGGMEAQGIVFDGVDEALRVPGTDLRLFGKPELCQAPHGRGPGACGDVETARSNAKLAAGKVKPRKA